MFIEHITMLSNEDSEVNFSQGRGAGFQRKPAPLFSARTGPPWGRAGIIRQENGNNPGVAEL